MRVPFSWIKEYVAWHGTVEELAEVLTMSGTEVEGIDWVGAPRDPENLSRFVVGKVLTKEQHPNADKLSLCTVEVGQANGGVRQIVCGADNFVAGDTVAVSLSGAVLENGLKLKKANLRGVESDGMMMSEQELGYEDKSPGIAVLPDEWIVGAPLQDYLPVSEAVLELELTSNRPDCFSIYGIAREVAAAARLELAPPPIAAPAAFGGAPVAESIAVEIADPDLCPRYVATRHPRRHHRRVAGVAQGAPHARRHAPHQQRRRRHQLRDARLGPAAARVRRRQDPRRQAHRPPRQGRREDRHAGRRRAHAGRPDARHRRRRASAGHRRRVRQRRRRDRRAHHRHRARGGQLRRPEHPAHRAAHRHPQRGQQPLREGHRPRSGAGRARLRRPAVRRAVRRHRRAGHGRRRRRPAGSGGAVVPAGQDGGAARLRRARPRAGRHPAPAGVRGRRGRRRLVRPAAHVPARPDPRGRPRRGGGAHRRLRPRARDAAAPHHRRAADPGAEGPARHPARPRRLRPGRGDHVHVHRPGRPRSARAPGRRPAPGAGPDLQPDERRAVGDAHHAAAGPARRRARQPRPAQRAAEPLRDRQGVPVGRAVAGARARRRARGRAAA